MGNEMYGKRYEVTQRKRVIAVSKVFQRGKTVIPIEVRKILGLKDGDKIVWLYEAGRVLVEPSEISP